MTKSNPTLSFIIPAYNEEQNISETIAAIKKYTPNEYEYEVIVVDHASHDKTVSLAERAGASVFRRDGGSVAGLRNYGASRAAGKVFIFLDADVRLTQQWKNHSLPILQSVINGDRILTGSWVSVSQENNWIERFWFEPQQNKSNTHINSGHMIVGHDVFDLLGGFDESLETGEDYDISMRAKKNGIEVQEQHQLKVVHEGYPKNLVDFVKREYWHGKGDAASLRILLSSKVALISLLVIMLHVVLLVALFAKILIAAYFAVLCIAALCLISSYTKFRLESVSTILVNSIVYYFYFVARGLSLLVNLFTKRLSKRHR